MTITASAHTLYGLSTDTKPTDVDTNRLFLETDTLRQYLFNGTTWELLPSGGVTGLNPNSTTLEHSTDITDYTTPVSATATSPTSTVVEFTDTPNNVNMATGATATVCAVHATASSVLVGDSFSSFSFFLFKVGSPTGNYEIAVYDSAGIKLHAISDTNDAAALPSSITKTTFFADDAITIEADDYIGLKYTGGDGSNTIRFGSDAAGGFDGDNTLLAHGVGSFSDFAGEDGAFSFEGGSASDAIDGKTGTFWESDAGINESITLDMGSVVNAYGLAYYIDKVQSGITETQFQIIAVGNDINGDSVWGFEADKIIEDFTTYVDQTAMDASWVTDNIATLRGNPTTDVLDWNSPTGPLREFISYDMNALGNLSDTAWVLRFKHDQTTDQFGGTTNNKIQLWFYVTSINGNTGSNADSVGIKYLKDLTSTENISIVSADGVSLETLSNETIMTITPAVTVRYYEFIRVDSTTFRINVFSDGRYSVLVETIDLTIPVGIADLRYFQVGYVSQANSQNNMAGTIDDIELFNNITSVPEITTTLRTVDVADLTDQAYNFIRFNGITTQFLTIEGSSGNSLVMAANELAVLTETDPPLTTLHGQFTISGNDDTLPLDGGDPTSFMVENPLVNQITFNNVATPNDPELEKALMWQETVDADNNELKTKIKVDGITQTFTISPLTGGLVQGIATIQSPDGTLGKLAMSNDGRLEIQPTSSQAGINQLGSFENITLVNTTTPPNPDTGNAVFWVETVDSNNEGVFAKIKVDGTFKTVRII